MNGQEIAGFILWFLFVIIVIVLTPFIVRQLWEMFS